jgi:acetyltransferase-like isoleucine patch superfamily enzyme
VPFSILATWRTLLRESFVGLMVVFTAPLWLVSRLEIRFSRYDSFFLGCSELLSMIPGVPGIYVRRGFYKMALDQCPSDCHVGFGTILAHPQVRIGSRVYIGLGCMLGKVVVDDDVTIGDNVDVLSGRRQHHFDNIDAPIQAQGGTFIQVRIGKNSWIGNRSIIMDNVGCNCIIGAGSVVTKPIPDNGVAYGNPATVKRKRDVGSPASTVTPEPQGSTHLSLADKLISQV